jgi:hypothetical protein
VLKLAESHLSDEHFTVDGTLIEAWASQKSFQRKDGGTGPDGEDFHGEQRRNDTHQSKTDPDAKLYRKGRGQEAKLSYLGHVLMENRNGLIVDAMVNRSVTWADWDEELLALELEEIQEADFDLSLTGFDPGEIDGLLALEDDEKANAAPPLPESPVSRMGDLWLLGPHRVLCGDATNAEVVARLLGDRKPRLLVTDPPYGIELDSE